MSERSFMEKETNLNNPSLLLNMVVRWIGVGYYYQEKYSLSKETVDALEIWLEKQSEDFDRYYLVKKTS
jgi:hypothetical protein